MAFWDKPQRVVAKVKWYPGELFPRVDFVVTNVPMDHDWIINFNNQPGAAEQHFKEGKQAITGPGCPARAWHRTKFACNFMRWPTIWVFSYRALKSQPGA